MNLALSHPIQAQNTAPETSSQTGVPRLGAHSRLGIPLSGHPTLTKCTKQTSELRVLANCIWEI